MSTWIRKRAMRRCSVAALMVAGLCSAADPALAVGACTVSSSGLAFGAYQPLTLAGKLTSADRTSTATVSVVCSAMATGSYTLGLGAGNYGTGDRIGTRFLNNTTQGGALMAFNVYTAASYGTVWGTGAIGALMSNSIPAGDSNQTHTVYGRIPAGQNTLRAGSYGDSLTITITYAP